jgi:hypothetical protein
MTEPLDLDGWRKNALATTRRNAPGTPQGDWTGVFLVETGEEMAIVPTSPYRLNRQVWTKALTVWFPGLLVAKEARAYALVDHVWQSTTPQAHILGTAADPQRTEAVMVYIGARTVEGEVLHETWDGAVTRFDARPPQLGSWRECIHAEGDRVGPLQAALHHLANPE